MSDTNSPAATFSTLSANLAKAGQKTLTLPLGNGASALLLRSGGRVLGLFPGNDEPSFLWANLALLDGSQAGSVFQNPHWINPGGDRTWLGPEHEWFIGDLSRAGETYRPPSSLDPADYQLAQDGDGATLRTQSTIHSHRTQQDIPIEIRKRISPIANPLAKQSGLAHMQFVGYRSEIGLRLAVEPKAVGPMGLWQLLQFPPDGEMFIATYGRCTPRLLLGTVTPEELRAENGMLRYRMTDRAQTQKIAVAATQVAGRVGYLVRRDDGRYDLTIRNFRVDPSGLYIDAPWANLDETGYIFQACNVAEPAIGHFAELEHHTPAIGGHTGASQSIDVSDVWAFRGDGGAINAIAKQLLGYAVLD